MKIKRFSYLFILFVLIATSISADVYLGIYLTEIDSEKSNSQKLSGVYVHNVIKDSPAAKAGLQTGDILTAVDQEKLKSIDHFVDLLDKYQAGDKLNLAYIRNKQELTSTIILADKTKHEKSLFESKIQELLQESKTFIFRFESQEDNVIGVEIETNDSQDSLGVLITQVIKNSPAEKANLQIGDLILRVDKKDIRKASDLVDYLQKVNVGDKVILTILRNQKKLQVPVQVVQRKTIFE